MNGRGTHCDGWRNGGWRKPWKATTTMASHNGGSALLVRKLLKIVYRLKTLVCVHVHSMVLCYLAPCIYILDPTGLDRCVVKSTGGTEHGFG